MTLLTSIVLLLAASSAAADENPADVEQWARTLRIQVYDTFRADRPEFDRRRQQIERIVTQWQAAGQRQEDGALLVDWFQRAVRASQPGSIAPLPEPPQFGLQHVKSDEAPSVSPAVEPPATAPSTVTQEPEQPAPLVPPPQDKRPAAGKPHTAINMVELSARLTGYNRGVRAVEIKLSERRPCTAAELSVVVDDLVELTRRARDLSLYREHLITESERETLPTPAALSDAIALLGDRIFAARQAVARGEFTGTDAARQSELDQLDVLSRRLAEIATPK